jgi:hypothetical protein
MSENLRKELRKYDIERVLPAWDALIRGQQARLEALKVPTMFVSSETGDVEVRIQFLPNERGIPFSILYWLGVHACLMSHVSRSRKIPSSVRSNVGL